jgi:hypothetical protein
MPQSFHMDLFTSPPTSLKHQPRLLTMIMDNNRTNNYYGIISQITRKDA